MESINCYKQSMLDFLRDFEPLKHKYHVFPGSMLYPPAVTAEGAKYDNTFQFGLLSKKNFSGILGNLSLVYGNTEVVSKDIETYFRTEKEIIVRYLNLPLINTMFDEDYFEFEWDMHVGQNFAEHRSDYYRDHFIHQVRNMYMMHELLDKCFYAAALDALSDRNTGRIAEYACVKFQQFMLDKRSSEYVLCRNNAEAIRRLYDNEEYLPNEIKDFRLRYAPYQREKRILAEDYAFHYFFKYVIYASAYLSALFHDMGYPICHFLGIRSRVSEYNPALYMITQNITGSIDNIFSKLGDSLLFTIVSHDEIKSRMKRKSNGQYDHGLYSALTFLLHFYETDAIQALSPEKRCAVELAALAIYNHTLMYACAEKPEDARGLNYYQPVFRQNPVSFLLHFCDDLEEWDRRYFEVSDASALSVCSECHGILMPHEPSGNVKSWMKRSKPYSDIWGQKTSPVDVFDCFCTKKLDKKEKHKCFRRQTFFKRQIYLVTTAPKVTFSLINIKNNEKNDKKTTNNPTADAPKSKNTNVGKNESTFLHAKVHYDLFRLLQMAHINNTYAKFRLKDLRELKCRTYGQQYKNQCKDIPFDDIFIDAFMTANPVLIKVKMIERATSDVQSAEDGFLWKIRETLHNKITEASTPASTTTTTDPLTDFGIEQGLYDYLFRPITSSRNARIDFYVELLKLSQKAREGKGEDNGKDKDKDKNKNEWKDISAHKEYREFINRWVSTSDEFYNRVLGELIYDCVYQYRNEPNSTETANMFNYYMSRDQEKIYKRIYEPDSDRSDTLYDAVLKYCSDKNSFNQYFNDSKNEYIGYFGDLFFFELLNDLLYHNSQ